MQTSSYHSAVLQRCFDTARLIRQGGSFTDRYCLPRQQPRTQSRSKEAKTCFVLDFSNHQKKKHPPLFSRLPLRNETFRARRGHFNYRQAWAVPPGADPGRQARWGGGNHFITPNLAALGGAEGHQAAGPPIASSEWTLSAHPHWVCFPDLA